MKAGAQSDFQFVGSKGYVTDSETGLLELGHRYYIPILGRFLNQDPIGEKGGLNLYNYCDDDPLGNTDSSGTTFDVVGTPKDKSLAMEALHALHYLSPDMARMLNAMSNSSKAFYICSSSTGGMDPENPGVLAGSLYQVDYFFSGDNTICWNPTVAAATDDGIGNSPVMILAHELLHMYHFFINPNAAATRDHEVLEGWDNDEEKYTEEQIDTYLLENTCPLFFHNGIRSTHGGYLYITTGLFSTDHANNTSGSLPSAF